MKPRVLVVMEPHQDIGRLLRIARRKAQTHGHDWEVVAVETRSTRRLLNEEEKEQFLQNLTLARQMGAIITEVAAKTTLQGILDVLDERDTQHVLIESVKIGVKRYNNPFYTILPSLPSRLKKAVGDKYEITAIPLTQEVINDHPLARMFNVNLNEILRSLLAVVVATFAIQMIDFFWPHAIFNYQHRNKAILYMIACAYAAGRFGLLAGIITAVASFLTMSMLYVSPYFRLIIDDVNDASNLGLFLLSAILISFFGSREHNERESVIERADRLQSLLRMHRVTLNKKTGEETLQVLSNEISGLLDTDAVFFMPNPLSPSQLDTVVKKKLALSEADQRALLVSWEESKTTGVGSPYNPGCHWRFEPLLTSKDGIGVLGVHITRKVIMDITFGKLLASIADQSALILERLELGQIAENSRIQAEREKLRAMLLSSVSHDLKTPLVSVIGALSVFRGMGDKLLPEKRETLISTALEEAQRLDSFITNILEMTRLESGKIELKQEWVNPARAVAAVRKRLKDRLRRHEVTVKGREDVEVSMDSMMMEQVLQNLLDNAAKYTPSGTQIDVFWRADKNGFMLFVRDYGSGIPKDKLDKVFDKYERLHRQDRQVAGTGLGLAIAKAVINSQHGEITVENHPEGGAIFTVTLPEWRSIDTVKEVA